MTASDRLLEAIATCAAELPTAHVELLATRIATSKNAHASASAVSAVASELYAQRAQRLVDAWRAESDTPPSALALALRSALRAHQREANRVKVTAAWTGPKTPAVPVRSTEQVLLELIGLAEHRLILVSFAAYKVDSIVNALSRAISRGVDVRLILETSDAGVLDVDAAAAFKQIRRDVATYVWPIERRKEHSGSDAIGRLHAKVAIADEAVALVTSANLTGYAMAQNMELGLRVEGGQIPKRLADHFLELIAHDILVKQ